MKKIIILTIILLSLSFTRSASAIGDSFFPGSKKMQPPPAGIKANISNNVNSTGTVAPGIEIEQPKGDEVVPVQNVTPESTSFLQIIKWIVIILIILGIPLYFLTRKIESN
jgi:hypothetical protein